MLMPREKHIDWLGRPDSGLLQVTRPAVDHLVCCDPATALCGADQRGEVIGIGTPTPGRLCTACAVLDADPSYRCSSGCPG